MGQVSHSLNIIPQWIQHKSAIRVLIVLGMYFWWSTIYTSCRYRCLIESVHCCMIYND